jgi:phosphoserine phosphatase
MSHFKVARVLAIGDGATDLEARPPAAAMVGYGGVVSRERVVREADWFVTDFEHLRKLFL